MPVQFPTDMWREHKADEKRQFLAGEITADECYMDKLFPDAFIEITHGKLNEFNAAIAACPPTEEAYPKVMQAIESLVTDLNDINEDFDGAAIETGEREALCEFIDAVIVERGIDIDALAASQDCDRYELTDEWRDW